jgi:hypothetical protein
MGDRPQKAKQHRQFVFEVFYVASLRNRAKHPRECPVILPEMGTRTEVHPAMAVTDVEHQ